jgi:hypothetical protein
MAMGLIPRHDHVSGIGSGQVDQWFNIQYGEIDMAQINISTHQALIGSVGELTGQKWTWGYCSALGRILIIIWRLGEGKMTR